MAGVERKTRRKELEPGFNRMILIIDDEPDNMRGIIEDISAVSGLEAKVIHPDNLLNITKDEIKRTSLILADQFLNHPQPMIKTGEFLEKLTITNPKVEIIEISYNLRYPVYKNSIGTIDSLNLIDEIRMEMETWPKNADIFITKLKWKSNYAFKEADKADKIEDDEDVSRGFIRASRIFEKLTKDKNFSKLIAMLDVTEDEFLFNFISDNDLSRRTMLLHNSWQIIGHIVCGNSDEFYAMSVQRLKESVNTSRGN